MNSRDNQWAAALKRQVALWLAGFACLAVLAWAVPSTQAAETGAAKSEHAEAKAAPAAADAHGHAAGAHEAPTMGKQFLYSYLTVFMFFLSLCMGSLFLVILHHLFDAGWSVPVRRIYEHIACLIPYLGVLFIPILLGAKTIYPWMSIDPHHDHALHAKAVLFNQPAFIGVSIALFVIWSWLSLSFRKASLAQDKDGSPVHTSKMRKLAAGGIFIFAFSLTLGAIYWMKSLQHQFFSTMYGVYYFAGSVWLTLATVYVLTMYFKKAGPLAKVVHTRQFYDLGVIFFAFTVFYAYIHFSQYFLIWNAAVPEETFWYVLREKGTWWYVGMMLIFGHFFFPFLTLLRIDAKLNFAIMLPMAVWAWLMHYMDMQFNIMPLIHPDGVHVSIWDLVCFALFAGVFWFLFKKNFYANPPYPQKDPRFAESQGVYVEPASSHAPAHGGAK